jgi:hypothetical protein
MTRKRFSLGLLTALLASATTEASVRVVTMSVTTPDGRTQEPTAPESSVARLTLKDGTEYEFRPTIQDSSPWNRIVVTIFQGRYNYHAHDSSRRGRGQARRPACGFQDESSIQGRRDQSVSTEQRWESSSTR